MRMNKGTVLVIDDEKDLLELVRYNLEKERFDVICTSDGASGLEIAINGAQFFRLLALSG